MEVFKKYGLFMYWMLILLDCTFLMIDEPELRWVTKVFSIPLLFLYLLAHSSKKHNRSNHKYFFYAALAFGWGSDLLSLINGNDFLKHNLIALLVMHISYAVFFYSLKSLKDNAPFILIAAIVLVATVETGLYQCFESRFVGEKLLALVALGVVGGSIVLAVNVLSSSVKKRLAIRFFVPGMLLISFSYVCLLVYSFFLQKELFMYVSVLVFNACGQSLLVEGEKKIV